MEWRVYFVPPFHPSLQRSDGSYTLGSTDETTGAICIADNLTSSKLKKVLCHELTHAAMFSYGITLNLDEEEILADLIATYGQEIISTTNTMFSRIKEKRGTYM